MRKGVDYLPMAKPIVQLTTRGSAVTVRLSSCSCRSLVVLCEGRDLCPLDEESWLEACEIGEQGGLSGLVVMKLLVPSGSALSTTVRGFTYLEVQSNF